MYKQNRVETFGQIKVDYRALREMPRMPDKSPRPMGDTLPIGTPRKFIQCILNSNSRRERLNHISGKGTMAAIQAVLQPIQIQGADNWEPTDSALFWMLRAWFHFGQTSLPPTSIQCGNPFDTQSHPIPGRLAPSENTFRSMASWALRHSAPQFELLPICLQIYNEIQRTRFEAIGCDFIDVPDWRPDTRKYSFPTTTTASWIQWLGFLRGRTFPIPEETMGSFEFHRDRWKKMGLGPYHAEIILDYAGRSRLIQLNGMQKPTEHRRRVKGTGQRKLTFCETTGELRKAKSTEGAV